MVLKTLCDSTIIPTSRKPPVCLVCLETIQIELYVADVTEILCDLFEVLCKYMEWSPPLEYHFDFNNDTFPFCNECKSALVTLYKSHELLGEVQKQITCVISKLSGKILLSQGGCKEDFMRNKLTGSGQSDSLSEEILPKNDKKIGYYRELIGRRYSALVRVTTFTHPLLNPSPSVAVDQNKQIDFGVPGHLEEINEAVNCEFEDFEYIDAETKNTNLCNQETKEVEITENARKVKRNSRRTEVSELLILNYKRIPKKIHKETTDQEEILTQQLSEEVSSEYGQTGDSDYEPRIVSRKNVLSDNDADKSEEITEPATVDAKERAQVRSDEFHLSEDELVDEHSGSEIKSNACIESKKNDIDMVSRNSDEGTQENLSNTTSISSHLNSINKNTGLDRRKSEDMNENINDEVEIPTQSNIFQSAELKNRIQKIGPSRYLLDDKHSFEFGNNKWKCIACTFICTKTNTLKRHLDECPGYPPNDSVETLTFRKWTYDKLKSGTFQCRHCKHISSSKDDVIIHLRRCHKPRPVPVIPTWIELELNKFLCNDKYPFERIEGKFKCGTCSASCAERREMLKHIQSKHIPDANRGKKRMSIKITTPDKFIVDEKFSFEKIGDEYRCCDCIYSSRKITRIKIHMLEKHVDITKFSCRTCGRHFPQRKGLTLHEATHMSDRPFICELCGKTFKIELHFKTHKNNAHLESSDANFSCKICGKAFRFQGLLKSHEKTHEYVICHVCGKYYKRYKLKEHLASHSKVKNYECTKCDKKYQCYNGLYVHMKCHDGVKPYSCDICGMTFTQCYSVTRHKNVVHNSNKTTKTCGKSRKRKHYEDLSEEEKTDDEEMSNEEELPEEAISDGEKSNGQEICEEEEN